MQLLSLNKTFSLIFLLIFTFETQGEETVDIWSKDKATNILDKKKIEAKEEINSIELGNNKSEQSIEVIESISDKTLETKLYGIFDPDENNFNLTMWSYSKAGDIKEIISRIGKLKLSKSAEDIFINTLFSHSYLPKDMSEKNFLDIKINWLIKNKKDDLLEKFLNKNENFYNKEKIIQYLVDKSIAKGNIKKGCEKVNFINKEIKDSYLEKFKIYCLVFNNKKDQAQLLYGILKEQNLSDDFFDDKINYLIGISDKTTQKINERNLLNFYLSSVTIDNFKFEPDKNTKKIIWEYLNSVNLIKIENIEDIEKIKELEIAANQNIIDKSKIFDIYKKISFDLNTLMNADSLFQNFDTVRSRAVIYQKFLLSDNTENKIKLLFILKDSFKKEGLSNIYIEFMSNRLKELDKSKIPKNYLEIVGKNIISETEYKLGKIKYDDKTLHRSRVIKYYTEPGAAKEKIQKDLINVYKKIKRDKKYFFSAKDLVFVESLANDGFNIPKEIDYKTIAKKYNVPKNLLKLADNNETGFLALKFVEIIGEDEISTLDPETIYFITYILNRAKLIKFRNQVIISALPLRS
jgi:hypothetical protein